MILCLANDKPIPLGFGPKTRKISFFHHSKLSFVGQEEACRADKYLLLLLQDFATGGNSGSFQRKSFFSSEGPKCLPQSPFLESEC